MTRPTTKHSHIGTRRDIQKGVYFKTYGKWFRATEAARPYSGIGSHYEWEVPALSTDGFALVVGLPGLNDEVELADAGTTPGPFTPSTLRAKARKLDDQATELQKRARRIHRVADALQLEAKAPK